MLARELTNRRVVPDDERMRNLRRADEVVRRGAGVVTELADPPRGTLELETKRCVRARPSIADSVLVEDANSRDDRNRREEQEAADEVERGPFRRAQLGSAWPAGLFVDRRSNGCRRRCHMRLIDARGL